MSEVALKSHLEDSHFRLAFAGTKEVEKMGILVGKVQLAGKVQRGYW